MKRVCVLTVVCLLGYLAFCPFALSDELNHFLGIPFDANVDEYVERIKAREEVNSVSRDGDIFRVEFQPGATYMGICPETVNVYVARADSAEHSLVDWVLIIYPTVTLVGGNKVGASRFSEFLTQMKTHFYEMRRTYGEPTFMEFYIWGREMDSRVEIHDFEREVTQEQCEAYTEESSRVQIRLIFNNAVLNGYIWNFEREPIADCTIEITNAPIHVPSFLESEIVPKLRARNKDMFPTKIALSVIGQMLRSMFKIDTFLAFFMELGLGAIL